ncbi:S41 family peptidase [Paracoccaceae bacterium GXU_MW_L88]
MKKNFLAVLTGAGLGVAATTQLAAPLMAQEAEAARETYEQLDLFGEIFERVRGAYVEEVTDKELIEAAISGMLSSLDPHSGYLPPEDFEEMEEQTSGEFGGLGIEVTQEEGMVKVIAPMEGTPAEQAGVEAGDFISHIDGESVLGLTLNEAVEKMRGPVGSDITVTLLREGEEPFDVTITRDTISVQAVRSSLEGEVVVLRINSFSEKTTPDLESELNARVEELGGMENVRGFVIDLRNNPGGLLEEAISVSDAFLDAGEIVSTRGRIPEQTDRWNAAEGDMADGKPIAVLINGGSASASEIVAGALQDHNRAVVVGTKSFGKGSVQTVMPVGSESAMRLTTARYYTPSGRSIQALGVSPDVIVEAPTRAEVEAREAAEEEAENAPNLFIRSESDLRGALDNDSLTEDERTQLEEERTEREEAAERRAEDPQLATAVDIVNAMTTVGESGR